MTLNLQFTPQDWERIKRDWTAWWHHDLDRPMVVAYKEGKSAPSFVPQFEGWDIEQGVFPVDEVLDQVEMNIETRAYYGDAWPTWWPNFGAGVVAAFLGSGVGVDENTVWFEPLVNAEVTAARAPGGQITRTNGKNLRRLNPCDLFGQRLSGCFHACSPDPMG